MNRRRVLIALGGSGAVGGSLALGGTLYGSSDLTLARTDDGTAVQEEGEQIDSLSHAVTPVENDDALIGISFPNQSTVQTVAIEVVWALKRDGIWSDITFTLRSTDNATFDSGVANAYSSPFGRSPSEVAGPRQRRQYEYPRGTTAGRVDTTLTVYPRSNSEKSTVEFEVQLSAQSLTGNRVELTAPAELTYSLE